MSNNKGYFTPKRFDTPLSHFKTPKTCQTPSVASKYDSEYFTPVARDMSDSEESTKSSAPSETGTGSCNSDDLSIVAEFDDLMRSVRQQRCDEVEDKFIDFAEKTKRMNRQWQIAVEECRRLQVELDKKTHDNRDLECKLGIARKLIDQEKKRFRKVEHDRDSLEMKIGRAANILFNGGSRLPDETRQQLAFLHDASQAEHDFNGMQQNIPHAQLSAIQEVNTTGSLLSDFSYSRSEDDLDSSGLHCGKSWKKHRPSMENAGEPALKKRRSANSKVVEINATDKVRATTTLTVSKEGPITATSIIESVPTEPSAPPRSPASKIFTELHPSAPPAHLIEDLWQHNGPQNNCRLNIRQHSFQTKTTVMPETCGPCNKRTRFGRTVLKCKDCRAVCHPECKDGVPLPCIPLVNTPTQRGGILGVIGDYTPAISPMVPGLIVHCTNEIEMRGLNEIGIYRIPGSEKEVKGLKEKFLRSKTVPYLNQVDVHVICGTVKDFLRSLHEPLITRARWAEFIRAVESRDIDINPVLCQIISELPQPNRDTLAYMMLHLKRVGDSPECKMPVKNLAKVFGPTIVGYSSNDLSPNTLLMETKQLCDVMEHLLNLPTDYWNLFVNFNYKTPTGKLQQTPSTDSLLCPRSNIFSPHSVKSTLKKKQRFFPTPP